MHIGFLLVIDRDECLRRLLSGHLFESGSTLRSIGRVTAKEPPVIDICPTYTSSRGPEDPEAGGESSIARASQIGV